MELTIFKEGDRVRHRANKVEGVIVAVCTACTNDEHEIIMQCFSLRNDCDRKPNGDYDVSIGFNNVIEDVNARLLEYSDDSKRNAEATRKASIESA